MIVKKTILISALAFIGGFLSIQINAYFDGSNKVDHMEAFYGRPLTVGTYSKVMNERICAKSDLASQLNKKNSEFVYHSVDARPLGDIGLICNIVGEQVLREKVGSTMRKDISLLFLMSPKDGESEIISEEVAGFLLKSKLVQSIATYGEELKVKRMKDARPIVTFN
jgi:hypothetical protein